MKNFAFFYSQRKLYLKLAKLSRKSIENQVKNSCGWVWWRFFKSLKEGRNKVYPSQTGCTVYFTNTEILDISIDTNYLAQEIPRSLQARWFKVDSSWSTSSRNEIWKHNTAPIIKSSRYRSCSLLKNGEDGTNAVTEAAIENEKTKYLEKVSSKALLLKAHLT